MDNKTYKTLILCGLPIMALIGWLAGVATIKALPPEIVRVEVPVVNTIKNTEVRLVEVPEPYKVIKTITEIVTVNNTVEVPVVIERIVNKEWREYDNLEELVVWLEDKIVFLMPYDGDYKNADCDDYAERLQLKAYKDGYLMSSHIVEGGRINGKVVSDNKELHMGNLTMIGDDVFFIEAQPSIFRVVFICKRD